MRLIETTTELRDEVSALRKLGKSLSLVPTMGAFHDGHRSLMRSARVANDVVAVSIFVNPLQFNDDADFEHYPRDLDHDLDIAGDEGVDIVFAPSVNGLYAAGVPVVRVDPGPMGDGLEGASRPGHFIGVATVVAKLFALISPDRAYFGEKDYEQLVLVRRLVADLSFPIEVVGCETIRDDDGLARSSRNERLTAKERLVAPLLFRALCDGAEALRSGRSVAAAVTQMEGVLEAEPLISLDYAAIRDASTMQSPGPDSRALRLLIAARLGAVRLIDNLGVDVQVPLSGERAGVVT